MKAGCRFEVEAEILTLWTGLRETLGNSDAVLTSNFSSLGRQQLFNFNYLTVNIGLGPKALPFFTGFLKQLIELIPLLAKMPTPLDRAMNQRVRLGRKDLS